MDKKTIKKIVAIVYPPEQKDIALEKFNTFAKEMEFLEEE